MTLDGILLGRRFLELERLEYSWAVRFTDGVVFTVECLWRLFEDGRICVTNRDDGHPFGLPAPVDAVDRLRSRLTNCEVTGVELQSGTNDLRITFASGHVLELIPDSCGYEAWHAYADGQELHAVGGGGLHSLTTSGD